MTALGQTVTCLRDLKLPAGGARSARRFVDPCFLKRDKIFSLFMRGQQLLLYSEKMIKNSSMLIQVRLVPYINTSQVVHKTLDQ